MKTKYYIIGALIGLYFLLRKRVPEVSIDDKPEDQDPLWHHIEIISQDYVVRGTALVNRENNPTLSGGGFVSQAPVMVRSHRPCGTGVKPNAKRNRVYCNEDTVPDYSRKGWVSFPVQCGDVKVNINTTRSNLDEFFTR